MSRRNFLKFAVLCCVWGLTWIAVKLGVETVPPMVFAATRFMVAGAAFIVLAWARGQGKAVAKADIRRLIIVSLLMITLCYGPLFWGMQFVPSGTAAVLEMSLTPLALLAFGVALGEEHWNGLRAFAMLLGAFGLGLLFAPSVDLTGLEKGSPMIGLGAIAWAAVSSAWGSVLAKPLISNYGSWRLSGLTTLIGGTVLLIASLAIEPRSAESLVTPWEWQAVAGWLFLVIFGSLLGYSIYMQLLRDTGPARAGSFAFVSPAIAVSVGVIFADEPAEPQRFIGMGLMVLAAAICLSADRLPRFSNRRPTLGVTDDCHR
ncbi:MULTISPECIES: DMT family transporter [unclassified Rhizobium]|uniref:DMT family transporter n=1 Tax=unclassified Rhizobium TaxID=2613769 RepID=UPI0007EA9F31|nr:MULTISPECIES: EamA family transporter [unclassified Rhizobium]ANM13316.1 DMT superfamily inner membrane transporter protein [Rhizobium sp. N324]ANM19717.1 DMT superfamily inner membrane transporter protein [Rhizobium sp. N541]ANM26102.1 DMT superfamily inner membrane transporter protein [Rhizobium sp. N941]OYD01107.1 DMT superfamily inner membrane transporter protein [Rhizobium sp. N4311]